MSDSGLRTGALQRFHWIKRTYINVFNVVFLLVPLGLLGWSIYILSKHVSRSSLILFFGLMYVVILAILMNCAGACMSPKIARALWFAGVLSVTIASIVVDSFIGSFSDWVIGGDVGAIKRPSLGVTLTRHEGTYRVFLWFGIGFQLLAILAAVLLLCEPERAKPATEIEMVYDANGISVEKKQGGGVWKRDPSTIWMNEVSEKGNDDHDGGGMEIKPTKIIKAEKEAAKQKEEYDRKLALMYR